jgi:hypothetical protein
MNVCKIDKRFPHAQLNFEHGTRGPTARERRLLGALRAAHRAALGVLQEHDASGRRRCPCPVCENARHALRAAARLWEDIENNLYLD